jgi:hypothetical protein
MLKHLSFFSLESNFNLSKFYRDCSSRPIRFAGLSHRERDENKENSKPKEPVKSDDDSDSEEGPVLYRDDDGDGKPEDSSKIQCQLSK